jgi:hypothetical protein
MTILCLSFLAFYYWLSPSEKVESEIDIIEIKQSATKRALPEVAPAKLAPPPPKVERAERGIKTSEILQDRLADEAMVSDLPRDDEAYFDQDELVHHDEIPWDEFRAGWRDQLKELLFELDPVNGESIYSAYQAETNAFETELENLAQSQHTDSEYLMGELEARHHEKLRQIFGPFYRDVIDQHSHYNSSLQHLSRSPNSYAVGVAL